MILPAFLRCTGLLVILAGAGTFAVPQAQARSVLYISDVFYPQWPDGYIRKVNTDRSRLEIVRAVGEGLRGFDIDLRNHALYYADVEGPSIKRIDLATGNLQTVVDRRLSFPIGIALSVRSGELFWADQGLNQVGQSTWRGKYVRTYVAVPAPTQVHLDSLGQQLYWSSFTAADAGVIQRAALDGHGIETVIVGHGKPVDFAIDSAGGKIYWADYVQDVVRRANLDGTEVQDLYAAAADLDPGSIALDITAGKVYWGQAASPEDPNHQLIMRMNLDGSSPEEFLPALFGNIVALRIVSDDSHDAAFGGEETRDDRDGAGDVAR
jgi:hypothetical protein